MNALYPVKKCICFDSRLFSRRSYHLLFSKRKVLIFVCKKARRYRSQSESGLRLPRIVFSASSSAHAINNPIVHRHIPAIYSNSTTYEPRPANANPNPVKAVGTPASDLRHITMEIRAPVGAPPLHRAGLPQSIRLAHRLAQMSPPAISTRIEQKHRGRDSLTRSANSSPERG